MAYIYKYIISALLRSSIFSLQKAFEVKSPQNDTSRTELYGWYSVYIPWT